MLTQGFLSRFSLASQILEAFVAPVSNCKALHLSHILQQKLAQVSLFILNTFPKGNTANISAGVWGMVRMQSLPLPYQILLE